MVMAPMLIAEVLSKSTQSYDQGDKFMYYRSIPDMREYLLVDQKQHHVISLAQEKIDIFQVDSTLLREHRLSPLETLRERLCAASDHR
ncbi:hypothetical protein XM38_024370 [Halomicronema hongdechloris C2206]|uniref:Putative restriction endonuclease domain-containing protein n=1 Tax=Halomicronema hongdechloris C2206 TaxID=1641165 RepID=A0A1Z3HMI5_9CYAN|nr:hypothetical protein XM38_024370 [Halomicronema hongdechloris C2206]